MTQELGDLAGGGGWRITRGMSAEPLLPLPSAGETGDQGWGDIGNNKGLLCSPGSPTSR